MSKIGIAEVERVATLARIGLSPEEAAEMAAQIGQIVGFVEQLQSVDVADVAPTDQVNGLVDVMRVDEVRPGLSRDAALANAPAQKDGYFMVKRVLNG
ncbi:MAG TPA: Asp-tRNA(Asn)/Glu-tRNA(Gln) amidotransferase subunit GatC [Candidatus Saccharimonadia bacterium]|nr:Asp-tRNA(Asn)/Glu-tRNA(Gln) amidotransferase subunit GatC [Candidatus Saccharimonadia bacterium]